MKDILALFGFVLFATGLWWLAPWLSLSACGLTIMLIAGWMQLTVPEGKPVDTKSNSQT